MKLNAFLLLGLALLLSACYGSKSMLTHSFSGEQSELIMDSDSLTAMRVFKITNNQDSLLLRSKSKHIKANPNDLVLQRFVKRLYATVRDSMSLGVGIAAPQVGILKNIIWVQRFDKENVPFEVYLNPVIKTYSNKKQTVKEGCLSIPNRSDTLNSRAFSIVIEYDTMNANHKTETVEGFTSVIFQHEIDHLNGILYLDHLAKEVTDAKQQN
ncbi:peptide deformylase [Mariniflexile sp. AS56]|uniref:peptide deformylase n=1 Tax=Mariniflexile sp. AS56 TaxID=3063957 RepID=UPI0026E94B6B|nr:peptide deformylase [Mariniflexile sp. AS56]MDO7173072.1 peptide deformylase [Mariniflexile sp. AS56]